MSPTKFDMYIIRGKAHHILCEVRADQSTLTYCSKYYRSSQAHNLLGEPIIAHQTLKGQWIRECQWPTMFLIWP